MSCIDAPRLENALGEVAGPMLWVYLVMEGRGVSSQR